MQQIRLIVMSNSPESRVESFKDRLNLFPDITYSNITRTLIMQNTPNSIMYNAGMYKQRHLRFALLGSSSISMSVLPFPAVLFSWRIHPCCRSGAAASSKRALMLGSRSSS